jgi:hypothetical protein
VIGTERRIHVSEVLQPLLSTGLLT